MQPIIGIECERRLAALQPVFYIILRGVPRGGISMKFDVGSTLFCGTSRPLNLGETNMGRHMCQKCNISVDSYIGREIYIRRRIYISDGRYRISDGRYRYRTEDIHI